MAMTGTRSPANEVARRPSLFRTRRAARLGMGHRIETHWRPQQCMVITSKVVIAIGFFVAAETASADVGSHQSTFETLTGECTKVMLMDVLADPAVCSDQVTAIRSGSGTLGYAFTIDSQGNPKPWIISFSGANLRHESQNGGTNTFSVYKIYLTINGETNDLVGLGSSCSQMPMETFPPNSHVRRQR